MKSVVAELFEAVPEFAAVGVRAFTTTRALGSLSTSSDEPAATVSARWDRVRVELAPAEARVATARQVHGIHVLVHQGGWSGWLRGDSADGHIAPTPGTAVGVSVADCVPILICHASGVAAALHAGWRGIAAGILQRGIGALKKLDAPANELRVHLGPAICGKCYEVGRDVYYAVSGRAIEGKGLLDLRAELASKAVAAGVRDLTISEFCTQCHNDRFFSHRAGDTGRQFSFIVAEPR